MAAFLRFVVEAGALQFGNFTLKSGRQSPYFFNAGLFSSGRSIFELGRHYAQKIIDDEIEVDVLIGPAYKGIPLAVSVAIALYQLDGRDVPYILTRKELKDHGEGGRLIGAVELLSKPRPNNQKLQLLVVDDVVTAGTAVKETLDLLRPFAQSAAVRGVLIAFDRQERGDTGDTAVSELEREHCLSVHALANIADLLANAVRLVDEKDAHLVERIAAYRSAYCM